MKHIVIFTMYYWPEPTGIAPLATDLAEKLGKSGWRVTVVTGFPMMPEWEVYKDYRHRYFMREVKDGITILRSWVFVPARTAKRVMNTWKRVAFDTSLIMTALPALLTRRADLIVAIGPPLQTGFLSLFVKKIWGCQVLYWLQDIVPDAAVNVGMMEAGPALKIARRMEQAVYRGADRIGYICEGFRANLIEKGVPEQKQIFLPNWADVSHFDNNPPDPGMRRALGFSEDDFILVHAGSMGAKQALENVLRAVKKLGKGERIRLVFLGGGNRADALKTETRTLGLDCVSFLKPLPVKDYVNVLRMADLLVINQTRDVIDALIPSKLLTYLPSERATIAAVNARSETANFIKQANCGRIVEPDNPDALANGILELKRDPRAREAMGIAGAAFIRNHFEKSVLLERFESCLTNMLSDQ